jgi:DNA invertase Pin-like site-specific DNA recombinase
MLSNRVAPVTSRKICGFLLKGVLDMRIGYARVSTIEQNLDRQLEALHNDGVEMIYSDKKSGKDFERVAYQKMISELQEGDVLVIHSIDRLGRNYEEIIEQWRHINKELKVDIKVLDMPLLNTEDHKDLTAQLISDIVLQLLSYVAQLEREKIRQRQREGIEIAKKNGTYKGGKKKEVDQELFDRCYQSYKTGKITKIEFAKELKVSRPTLDRMLKAV